MILSCCDVLDMDVLALKENRLQMAQAIMDCLCFGTDALG